MKDKIKLLINELNEDLKEEQEFRNQSEPKPNPYDFIRSVDREETVKNIIKKLENIVSN